MRIAPDFLFDRLTFGPPVDVWYHPDYRLPTATAEAKSLPNESIGQAIGRLDQERDPDLMKLAAARDVQSFNEYHGDSFAKTANLVSSLEAILDNRVMEKKASGETIAAMAVVP